jgi:hypothetical protein
MGGLNHLGGSQRLKRLRKSAPFMIYKKGISVSLLFLIVLASFLVMVYAVSLGVNLAYACSCTGERLVTEYIEESSSTFVGTVEAIEANPEIGGYDVKFVDVARIWGVWVNDHPDDGIVTVWTTSLGAGDCGYPFEEGLEYLVYTQREESSNILKVGLCNGTKPVDQAEADLEILGTGTNPMITWRGNSIPATHSGRLLTFADLVMPTLYAAGASAAAWIFVRTRRRGKTGHLAPIFAGIAIALAFVFVLSFVYGGYVNLEQWTEDAEARENEKHLTCSTISGFWPYHKAGLAESIEKDSDLVIVVGTIKNVEMRILDFYSADTKLDPLNSTRDVVEFTPTGSKIPWKAVTLEVEKYLIDETGSYSKEIAFRTPANACVDNRTGEIVPLPASFASDPASDPDKSAKYNVGDRSLIGIHRWHGGEYRAEGLDEESTIKLDIDENGFVKPDYRTGIDGPIKIEALENEIAAELEKLRE